MLGRNSPAPVPPHLSHWLGNCGLRVNTRVHPKAGGCTTLLASSSLEGRSDNPLPWSPPSPLVPHRPTSLHKIKEQLLYGSHSSLFLRKNLEEEVSGTNYSPISALRVKTGTHPFLLLLSILNLPHPQPSFWQVLVALLVVESKPPSLKGIHILSAPGLLYVTVHSYNWVADYQEVTKWIIYMCSSLSPSYKAPLYLLLIRVNYSYFTFCLLVSGYKSSKVSRWELYFVIQWDSLLCPLARGHFL